MINLEEHLKAASLHADRMTLAREKLKTAIPLSPEKIAKLSVDELAYFELYTGRFAKLQDMLGAKIFTELLVAAGEQVDKLTMIDKLNLLERLEVVESRDRWDDICKVRNEFAHEYPDKPELLADNLNAAFAMGTELLECLKRAKEFAARTKLTKSGNFL
jgi:hypothetical protein